MGQLPQINNALGSPVVEQTQDFFVVFESIAATTPEIIDNSGYKIVYLVDGAGNISKPSENADSARNVIQNFELDNKVTVIIDQDSNENNALAGEHTIKAIGKPTPYLYSQNGIASESYEHRLVFRDPSAPPSGAYDPVDAYAGMSGLNVAGGTYPTPTNNTDQLLFSGSFNGNNDYYMRGYTVSSSADLLISQLTGSNGIYTINSLDAGIQTLTFQFQFRIQNNGYTAYQEYYLETGDWDGTTWTKTNEFLGTLFQSPVGSTSTAAYLVKDGTYKNVGAQFTLTANDIPTSRNFRVKLSAPQGHIDSPIIQSAFNLVSFVVSSQTPLADDYYVDIAGGDSNAPDYWDTASYGTNILKASERLSSFYQSIYVETAAQQNFGFDSVIIPFEPQPGDRIRFQYNENQLYTIYNVTPPNESSDGRLTLTLSGLPPTSSYQNFVMYRIDNSLANQLVLDVKKIQGIDDPNNPFTGIITPQYPSPNIKNNADKILEKLKADGIVKN